MAKAAPTEPTIAWIGDTCRIRWESRKLLLTLTRLRETSGGLVADSELWHDLAGLLDFGTLNLHSRSARETLVRKLEARIGKGGEFPNWAPLLERELWKVATHYRTGERAAPLEEAAPKPHAYLQDPLLSLGHTNVLYGPWESGKSTWADLLALSITTGRALPGLSAPTLPGHVIYCDWEAEQADHSASVSALAAGLGWPFPKGRIHYLHLRGRPLTMAMPTIAADVHEHQAVLWIGDSLEPASIIPGSESWHHASIAAFNAVSTLPCTRLFIGQQSHEERGKSNGAGRLFGSVFGMYLTRNAWAIRRTDEDETSGRLTFALYHHKASFDRRRAPMAFQIVFERPGFTTVRLLELADAPDLLARAGLRSAIQKLLVTGAQTVPELAEAIGKPDDEHTVETIERTLRRMRKAGKVTNLEERRNKHRLWGLVART
jgi:hypothetical protein